MLCLLLTCDEAHGILLLASFAAHRLRADWVWFLGLHSEQPLYHYIYIYWYIWDYAIYLIKCIYIEHPQRSPYDIYIPAICIWPMGPIYIYTYISEPLRRIYIYIYILYIDFDIYIIFDPDIRAIGYTTFYIHASGSASISDHRTGFIYTISVYECIVAFIKSHIRYTSAVILGDDVQFALIGGI